MTSRNCSWQKFPSHGASATARKCLPSGTKPSSGFFPVCVLCFLVWSWTVEPMYLECKPIQRVYTQVVFTEPTIGLAVLSFFFAVCGTKTVFEPSGRLWKILFFTWSQIGFGCLELRTHSVLVTECCSVLGGLAFSARWPWLSFMALVPRLPYLCDIWLLWHLIDFFDSCCGADLWSLTALFHAHSLEERIKRPPVTLM